MKKKVSASELMARLEADPDFLARREAGAKVHQERVAELRDVEAPIVRDLQDAGIKVDSFTKVTRETPGFLKALPILLRHLQESSHPATVREWLARTLAVPEAKFGWNTLITQYRNEREKTSKDGLAVALAAIADGDTIGDVTALFRDPANGSSRVLLVGALARSSDPKARAALLELRDDPDVAKEIVRVLGLESSRSAATHRRGAVSVPKRSRRAPVAETSMTFDSADIRTFLEAVVKLVPGFDEENIGRVVGALDRLDVEDETTLAFEVRLSGSKVPLEIRGFKDDVDAVDLYFRAPPALVRHIERLFSTFADERGL